MNEHEKVVRKLNHHVEALLQANETLTAEQSGNSETAGQILCSGNSETAGQILCSGNSETAGQILCGGNSEEIDALKVYCVCKLISLKEGSGRSLWCLVW